MTQEKCQCPTCGYEWIKHQSGKHNCSINLLDKVSKLEKSLKLAESTLKKVIPSDINQRQMINSYFQFKDSNE
jgi:hypothetical protein